MKLEAFFKVSHIRKDGGVGELTLIGYNAESTAFQVAKALDENPAIAIVHAVQRYETDDGSIDWHPVR